MAKSLQVGLIAVLALIASVALALPANNNNIKVVGGTAAKQGQFPHVAALLKQEISGGRTFFCGGALIAPTWVLTTADCLRSHTVGSTRVRTGELNLDVSTEYEQLVSVKRFVVHPAYFQQTAWNNMALVELTTPIVEIPGFVEPIKLPAANANNIEAGTECTVAGWGSLKEGGTASKTLQFAYIPAVSDAECGVSFQDRYDNVTQMCAGFTVGGSGFCGVDFGGPLQCGETVKDTLDGIISYGNGCARPGIPGVYNKVSSYVDWIQSTIEGTA